MEHEVDLKNQIRVMNIEVLFSKLIIGILFLEVCRKNFRKTSERVVFCIAIYRLESCNRKCSVKKGAHRDFANFTGKDLCWILFLTKLQALCLQLY